MKIVALMGVKDDVELIGACIGHLWSIGVDLVIAYDDGSTDGTLDILNTMKSEEHLWVVNVDRLEPRRQVISETWRLEYARKAKAEWVLFLDADEFWIPATGSLRDCVDLAGADVITVNRFNVPLTRRGLLLPEELSPSQYGDLILCVRTIPNFHLYIEQHPEVPWILGAPIVPKVMSRPDLIKTVGAGGHLIEPCDSRELRHVKALELLIAHLPFTTFERFERKASNITGIVRAFPEFFSGYVAWHWKRWAYMLESGQLREEFERQIFNEPLLSRMFEAGVIQTASAVLNGMRSTPGPAPGPDPDYNQLLEEWF